VPLPLSTVLILCIDLGTDMIPAISFAYENPELDIMDRQPRKSNLDHLVNTKLISFAYLQIGIIQASAGMYTYFLVLNDFGIRPQTVWRLALIRNPMPDATDVYDPNDYNPNVEGGYNDILDANGVKIGRSLYGHTNQIDPDETDDKENGEYEHWSSLSWDGTKNGQLDVRLFYARNRSVDDWVQCRFDPGSDEFPKFYKFSHITDSPICYSTEALKFAQSGYLVSIVCVQWADLMICKTRNLSLAQQGMSNSFGNFGLFSETFLVAVLLYVPFLNVALGTRQIPFVHFAVPSFSFFVAIFFYDELRKIWLRNGMVREDGRLKLKGWIV
jgi:sodium/potassium-transporting ATPase subunit alpha